MFMYNYDLGLHYRCLLIAESNFIAAIADKIEMEHEMSVERLIFKQIGKPF